MSKRNWFNMMKDDSGEAVIEIYDAIGSWDVNARDFRNQLKEIGEVSHINLRINTPGGDVIDGFAIYNMLLEHPAKITATIDGWAASMGSIIAMAADEIQMPANTWMMIHKPWSQAMGESDDLRRVADVLEKMESHAVNAYQRHVEMSSEDIIQMMADETWMDGKDAVEMGFATTLLDELQVAASVSRPGSLKEIPEQAMAWVKPAAEADEVEEEKPEDDQDKPEDEAEEEKPEAEETDATEDAADEAEVEAPADDTDGDDDGEKPEEKEDDEKPADDAADAGADEDGDDEPQGLDDTDIAYDEGFAAGYFKARTEASESFEKENEAMREKVAKAEAEVDKAREMLTDRDADIARLSSELAGACDTIDTLNERIKKLAPGLSATTGSESAFATFEDAVAEHGYEKARLKYPELYQASREYHRSHRRDK